MSHATTDVRCERCFAGTRARLKLFKITWTRAICAAGNFRECNWYMNRLYFFLCGGNIWFWARLKVTNWGNIRAAGTLGEFYISITLTISVIQFDEPVEFRSAPGFWPTTSRSYVMSVVLSARNERTFQF